MLVQTLLKTSLIIAILLTMTEFHRFHLNGGEIDFKVPLQHLCYLVKDGAWVLIGNNVGCQDGLLI